MIRNTHANRQGTRQMTATTTPAAAPATAGPGPASSPAPTMGRLRTADGLELASYRWSAGNGTAPPRATIALVHGLAEHAGRYAALAGRLNAAGIDVLAIDLRGHGQSPGKRAWVEHFDGYLNDADALVAEAARGNSQLFLMGHSMGGAVAALYAIERAPTRGHALTGLVLSSPALAPGRDVPRWMLAVSRVISRVWPTFPAIKIAMQHCCRAIRPSSRPIVPTRSCITARCPHAPVRRFSTRWRASRAAAVGSAFRCSSTTVPRTS